MDRQLARQRRRERIAGALVVGLGIAVLVVAVIALREPNGHVSGGQSDTASNVARTSAPSQPTTTAPSSASAPRTSDAHAANAVQDVPLIVLNNTTVSGLAGQAAQGFEAGGWTVTSFGNYQNDIASTCAYFDPTSRGAKGAAQALQRQCPTIKRVAPRFAPSPGYAPLPDGPVVVVLTPDYSPA
jgi:hypothetical protein